MKIKSKLFPIVLAIAVSFGIQACSDKDSDPVSVKVTGIEVTAVAAGTATITATSVLNNSRTAGWRYLRMVQISLVVPMPSCGLTKTDRSASLTSAVIRPQH
jgi:hypothetical protein